MVLYHVRRRGDKDRDHGDCTDSAVVQADRKRRLRKTTVIMKDQEKTMIAIKEIAVHEIGIEETRRIRVQARGILEGILRKYPTVQSKEQKHTALIFSHSAVYKALLHRCPDKAMQIMEAGEAVKTKERAKAYEKMVKLPFGIVLLLRGFAAGCKNGL